MATALGALKHFYKSAARKWRPSLSLDIANLILFILKNGEKIPKIHEIFSLILQVRNFRHTPKKIKKKKKNCQRRPGDEVTLLPMHLCHRKWRCYLPTDLPTYGAPFYWNVCSFWSFPGSFWFQVSELTLKLAVCQKLFLAPFGGGRQRRDQEEGGDR
jgi:hypothetical protein